MKMRVWGLGFWVWVSSWFRVSGFGFSGIGESDLLERHLNRKLDQRLLVRRVNPARIQPLIGGVGVRVEPGGGLLDGVVAVSAQIEVFADTAMEAAAHDRLLSAAIAAVHDGGLPVAFLVSTPRIHATSLLQS